MRLAWLAAAAAIWCAPSGAQIVSVARQPPKRNFGVFVGDFLTSTAILQVQAGTTLDQRSLPPEGPASPTIDVRRVSVGGTPTRIEIRVTYQCFFSPEQVSSAEVPGYTLDLSAGGKRLTAAVPGFSFTASTFRHDLQPTLDASALRLDHEPAPANASNAAWQITAGLASMACGVLRLVWPFAFAGRKMPFQRALSELARLQRLGKGVGQSREVRKSWGEWSHSPQTPQHSFSPRLVSDGEFGGLGARGSSPPIYSSTSISLPIHSMASAGGDAALEAMLVLHRAFDATAGRRMFADDLDAFISHHKQFIPLRQRIGAFFEVSRGVFFGANVQVPDVASWVGLCRDLANAERSG